jgi:hypothetical protein
MHGFVCLCEVLKVFKNDLKILERFEKVLRKNKTSQTRSPPPLLS